MTMKFDLSTGKTVDFTFGVIGIGENLDLHGGCEDDIVSWEAVESDAACGWETPYVHYTKPELIAMAKYGIGKFEQFIEKVNNSPDAWFESDGNSK